MEAGELGLLARNGWLVILYTLMDPQKLFKHIHDYFAWRVLFGHNTFVFYMVITLNIDPRRMEKNTRSGKIIFKYEDIVSMPEAPEGPRIELIKGDLFMAPSPTVKHQLILMKLHIAFDDFLKKQSIGKIFIAPVDVLLSESDVVVPDFFFILNEHDSIIQEKNVKGTPDFIIEVLSTNEDQDKLFKKALYEQFKVKEYWIIDAKKNTVEVFVLSEVSGKYGKGKSHSMQDRVSSTVVQGFSLAVQDLLTTQ